MKTTLNQIRAHHPCSSGWKKLLQTLQKQEADDEPVSILQVLDSNGLQDALWCLRAVVGYDKEIRLYAVWCARQVQHLMKDPRSLKALDAAEAYAEGRAAKEELAAARNTAAAAAAAADAAAYAAYAAYAAAAYAAYAAAYAAADAYAAAAAYAAYAAADAYAARKKQETELRRLLQNIEGVS